MENKRKVQLPLPSSLGLAARDCLTEKSDQESGQEYDEESDEDSKEWCEELPEVHELREACDKLREEFAEKKMEKWNPSVAAVGAELEGKKARKIIKLLLDHEAHVIELELMAEVERYSLEIVENPHEQSRECDIMTNRPPFYELSAVGRREKRRLDRLRIVKRRKQALLKTLAISKGEAVSQIRVFSEEEGKEEEVDLPVPGRNCRRREVDRLAIDMMGMDIRAVEGSRKRTRPSRFGAS
jgi:hypothetical protein